MPSKVLTTRSKPWKDAKDRAEAFKGAVFSMVSVSVPTGWVDCCVARLRNGPLSLIHSNTLSSLGDGSMRRESRADV